MFHVERFVKNGYVLGVYLSIGSKHAWSMFHVERCKVRGSRPVFHVERFVMRGSWCPVMVHGSRLMSIGLTSIGLTSIGLTSIGYLGLFHVEHGSRCTRPPFFTPLLGWRRLKPYFTHFMGA